MMATNFQKFLQNRLRKCINNVAIFFMLLFVGLFINLSYVQFVENDFLAEHVLNRRNSNLNESIPRGIIYDANGQVLADKVSSDGGKHYKRTYNSTYEEALAPIIGYVSSKYGKAGLESSYDSDLSGRKGAFSSFGPLKHALESYAGNNIYLTIDAKLQKKAYDALGNYKGAVVVINPNTGAILALVSKPTYIPSSIDQDWAAINGNDDGLLLNRATQGLYPPGSTIKVLMAESALNDKVVTLNEIFNCDGQLKIGKDYVMTDDEHEVHGNINLATALAVSCNVTFGRIALKMGSGRMEEAFNKAGFNRKLLAEIPAESCRLPAFSQLSDGELAQVGIGQGSLLVTPVHMALLAAAIADKGIMMRPYFVQKITAPDSSMLFNQNMQEELRLTAPSIAQDVAKMMRLVVTNGTGRSLRMPGIEVAGKTGTAENPHGRAHSWFIGFADTEKPEMAVAVIAENAGYGADVAASVAKELFKSRH